MKWRIVFRSVAERRKLVGSNSLVVESDIVEREPVDVTDSTGIGNCSSSEREEGGFC